MSLLHIMLSGFHARLMQGTLSVHRYRSERLELENVSGIRWPRASYTAQGPNRLAGLHVQVANRSLTMPVTRHSALPVLELGLTWREHMPELPLSVCS